MNKQQEALRLADALDAAPYSCGCTMEAAAELRRLYEANEAFAKRQEWWNDRMFELEKQRDELLEALKDVIADLEHEEADGWMSGQVHSDEYKQARAAIAKAEGKQ